MQKREINYVHYSQVMGEWLSRRKEKDEQSVMQRFQAREADPHKIYTKNKRIEVEKGRREKTEW